MFLVNKIVNIKSSILEGNINGSSVYQESHNVATNEYGVVSLTISQGTYLSGNFNSISWGSNLYFLKTELDISGGNNYQFMGTSQLMSVPYALYADKSGSSKNDLDTSVTNELQSLSINDHNISISNGNSITFPDNQQLSLSGNSLSISNGNTINLPPDNDADTSNEIQTLSLNANNLSISGGNTIFLPPDSDANPTNEIQALSLINDTLYLSNGGFVNMLPFKDNTDNQLLSITGNQLQISGGNSVTITGAVDLDADPTNELQLLSKSGDTLYLSQGNYVIIPPDADHDPTNELQTITVTGDSIKISNGGGTIRIPTPTNAILPSGSCITSENPISPNGYTYSGENKLSDNGAFKLIYNVPGVYINCSSAAIDTNFFYVLDQNYNVIQYSLDSNYHLNLGNVFNLNVYTGMLYRYNDLLIYCAGNSTLSYLKIYNLTTHILTNSSSATENLNTNDSKTFNNNWLVFGGSNGIHFYDILSDTWYNSSISNVDTHLCLPINNDIYFFKKTSNTSLTGYKFNIISKNFIGLATKNDFPCCNGFEIVFLGVYSNKILIATSYNVNNNIYALYDPLNDSYSEIGVGNLGSQYKDNSYFNIGDYYFFLGQQTIFNIISLSTDNTLPNYYYRSYFAINFSNIIIKNKYVYGVFCDADGFSLHRYRLPKLQFLHCVD
jgi:hypothetical protein